MNKLTMNDVQREAKVAQDFLKTFLDIELPRSGKEAIEGDFSGAALSVGEEWMGHIPAEEMAEWMQRLMPIERANEILSSLEEKMVAGYSTSRGGVLVERLLAIMGVLSWLAANAGELVILAKAALKALYALGDKGGFALAQLWDLYWSGAIFGRESDDGRSLDDRIREIVDPIVDDTAAEIAFATWTGLEHVVAVALIDGLAKYGSYAAMLAITLLARKEFLSATELAKKAALPQGPRLGVRKRARTRK